jgi:hypothetical protein
VDCLPAGCVLSETAILAGLAGAMAAFTACLAVVGLYVVVRYFAPYLFAAFFILLLMASLYIFIRRPEDARRFRRFLAERGREALGRLWGWATQRPEVMYISFFFFSKLGQLLKFSLILAIILQIILVFLFKNIL